ncbi:Uncharacterized protein Rs2_29030 [Raphanus sativus]|nr:Uncharacterized protein Rs2_29030 [Raphanus sativus]
MALTLAVKETIWLKNFVTELGYKQDSVRIHCDSQSAIALSKNAVHHERTKYMDTQFNFIRDIVSKGIVNLAKIHTSKNPADFLTKCLPGTKFESCCEVYLRRFCRKANLESAIGFVWIWVSDIQRVCQNSEICNQRQEVLRVGDDTTGNVPKVAPAPRTVSGVGDGGIDEAAEEASVQKKHVSLQRQAAVTVEAAEDCAWRFESGVNELSSKDQVGEELAESSMNSWAQHRDLFHWSLWSCPYVRRCDAAYHYESLNTNGLVSILAILIIHIPCRFRNFSIQDSSRFDFRWIAEILQESAKSFSA